MKRKDIIELRILPPIAIGRLGESETPLEAYDLKVVEDEPLGFRQIVPKPSFTIDANTGEITKEATPEAIRFKDVDSLADKQGKIRPVAPFLEVFAILNTNKKENKKYLVPLTLDLLHECGYSIDDISWDACVGNIKVYRRTGDEKDKIEAAISDITDHQVHSLDGHCDNFLTGKTLPLGTIQFIQPTPEHPEIRLRFTPAAGKVYGAALVRHTGPGKKEVEKDPIITSQDLVLYDKEKGSWRGYSEGSAPDPLYTNPAQIFAGYSNKTTQSQVSWGYLDDECDGIINVRLHKNDKTTLRAKAHINAGPPAFAPDTLPIRVVSDELEQILLGPEVGEEVPIEEAEDIIRRALETVRLMNTAIMNGNSFQGRQNVASTMVRQDTNDFGRLYEPIMATSIVDNLAVRALHERVFNGLSTGAAPWFSELLRRPEEIGDLSNEGRRKMPGLMRGADGRALCMTRRQISTIIQTAVSSLFSDQNETAPTPARLLAPLKAENLTAQLHYRGKGNPFAVLPRTAISNCFPGLEFDFRNLWRRAFKGIVLIENNNYIVDADDNHKDLTHHRLVAINHKPTTVTTSGPEFPGGDSGPLITVDNPNGVSFMEWSNNLASILQEQGQKVVCHFTKEVSPTEVVAKADELNDKSKYIERIMVVNHIFDGDTAALSDDILKPGELTQGLCAPWQNDYRECACYYWAASRPDFVNVVPNEKGLSSGDLWMSKKRSGHYIPDNIVNSQLLSYDDLFANWQGELNFIIKGFDAIDSDDEPNDGSPKPVA